MAALSYDIDGSARGARHLIPVGARVEVTRGGVKQPWGETRVLRHDRNCTYRLHFVADDTYVTAHEHELTVVAE